MTGWGAALAMWCASADAPGERLPKAFADAETALAARGGATPEDFAWTPLAGAQAESAGGATLSTAGPGAWTASGNMPDKDTYLLSANGKFAEASAVLIDFPLHDAPALRGRGGLHLAISEVGLKIDGEDVKFSGGVARATHETLRPNYAIDGDDGTAHLPQAPVGEPGWLLLTFAKPLPAKAGKATLRIVCNSGKATMPAAFKVSVGRPQAATKSARAGRQRQLQEAIDGWAKGIKPVAWTIVKPTRVRTASGAKAAIQRDRSITLSSTEADAVTLECAVKAPRISAFRLEFLPDAALPAFGPGRTGDGSLSLKDLAVSTPERGRMALAGLAVAPPGAGGAMAGDGAFAAPLKLAGGTGLPAVLTFRAADALVGDKTWKLTVQVATVGGAPGRLRLSVANAEAVVNRGLAAEVEDALLVPAERRTAEQQHRLLRHYLLSAPDLKEARADLDALRAKWRGTGR